MKAIIRQRYLLTALLVLSFCCYIRPIIGITEKGSIRIHFKHINLKQEKISLSLYDISEIIKANENMETEELKQEVMRRGLIPFTHTSDENQAVEWQELSKGSYLIIQPKAAQFGTMEPLFISLPTQSADHEPQMNVVIEPAIIQNTQPQDNTVPVSTSSAALHYIPTQTITIQDVLLLFCIFSGTILILSLWKYQREQREG